MKGNILLINEVKDPVFSSRTLGDGVAIEPTDGCLYSPTDAEVSMIFDTGHAIALTTESGMEILLHIGIDTVKLQGQHFTKLVENGQKVKKGDLLIRFDLDKIEASGYKVTTPMIICNTDAYSVIRPLKSGLVEAGDPLLEAIG